MVRKTLGRPDIGERETGRVNLVKDATGAVSGTHLSLRTTDSKNRSSLDHQIERGQPSKEMKALDSLPAGKRLGRSCADPKCRVFGRRTASSAQSTRSTLRFLSGATFSEICNEFGANSTPVFAVATCGHDSVQSTDSTE